MSAQNTDKLRKGFYGPATALSGSIGNSDSTIPLNSTAGFPTDTAIDLTIDRVDASGNKTPTKQETVTVVISGSGGINALRGVEGTAQPHSSGAVVEITYTAATHNNQIDSILQDHAQFGYHKQLTDTNGKTILSLNPTTNAANNAQLSNATAGSAPIVGASGSDTNIDLVLQGKGTGSARWGGYHDGWVLANETPTYASASTINVAAGSKYQVGDLIQFTQTTVKYFVVTVIASNVLTLVGLAGATVANAAITNFYYSRERAPLGLGLNGAAPFNPYKFGVYLANSETLGVAAWTKINLDTKEFDTGGNFDASTNHRFTAPVAGFYYFTATVAIVTAADGTILTLALYKNGGLFKQGTNMAQGASNGAWVTMSTLLQLNANDYVELWAYCNSNYALQTGSANNWMQGYLVSAV